MQTLGFVNSLLSGIDDRTMRENVLRDHKALFNTHPYLASYMLGAVLRLIEDRQLGVTDIKRFKGIGQGTMATSGDLFFWSTLRPTLSILGIIVTLRFGLVGPIAFLVLLNLFHLFHRFHGLRVGYTLGRNVLNIVTAHGFARVQQIFEITGLVVGAVFLAFFPFAPLAFSMIPLILLLLLASLILLYTKRPYGYLLAVIIAFLLFVNFFIGKI